MLTDAEWTQIEQGIRMAMPQPHKASKLLIDLLHKLEASVPDENTVREPAMQGADE